MRKGWGRTCGKNIKVKAGGPKKKKKKPKQEHKPPKTARRCRRRPVVLLLLLHGRRRRLLRVQLRVGGPFVRRRLRLPALREGHQAGDEPPAPLPGVALRRGRAILLPVLQEDLQEPAQLQQPPLLHPPGAQGAHTGQIRSRAMKSLSLSLSFFNGVCVRVLCVLGSAQLT